MSILRLGNNFVGKMANFISSKTVVGIRSNIIILDLNNMPWWDMNWIPLQWKSLKCTLLSIQHNYFNLEHKPPMLYNVDWNILCTRNSNYDVFSVGFLIYCMAHDIHHKHNCSGWDMRYDSY